MEYLEQHVLSAKEQRRSFLTEVIGAKWKYVAMLSGNSLDYSNANNYEVRLWM